MNVITDEIVISKNDDTKAAYLDRTKLLLDRYAKVISKPNFGHCEFVDWIISLKPEISRSTWRQYKASVLWYLELKNETTLIDFLKNVNNDGCKNYKDIPVISRKTSAKKKKSVTEREEQNICQYLNETSNDSYWSKPTLAIFKATLATGLRPEEWQSATLISEENSIYSKDELPVLRVLNAKNTNGRSHGEYRTLHLINMDKSDLLYIRIALQYTNPRTDNGWMKQDGKVKSWHEYYKFIRSHLYRITLKLYPVATRRVTIYSCRHQFIANLKKAKYSKEEIAAIVGHGTDETATVHYGRSKFGRDKKGLPTPNMDEVRRIKLVYKGRLTTESVTSNRPVQVNK
jgi:hypothetical protein